MPMVFLSTSQTRPEERKLNAPMTTTPRSWMPSGPKPPPKNRPSTVDREVTPAWEKRPTQIVPNTPQQRCTAVAPTGSSMWTRSKNCTANTTRMPESAPMSSEDSTET